MTVDDSILNRQSSGRNQLSSSSSISSWVHLYEVKYCNYQLRTIRIFPPVCIGRCPTKLLAESVKKDGPSPISNMVLAAVLEKAKELDVPNDILVYGYGGVSIVVEVLTDKINRSVAAVREVVKDYGRKMADPGSNSVSINFVDLQGGEEDNFVPVFAAMGVTWKLLSFSNVISRKIDSLRE